MAMTHEELIKLGCRFELNEAFPRDVYLPFAGDWAVYKAWSEEQELEIATTHCEEQQELARLRHFRKQIDSFIDAVSGDVIPLDDFLSEIVQEQYLLDEYEDYGKHQAERVNIGIESEDDAI